jgi:hypothetical protein
MAWIKIDDMFARHPKTVMAGPLGMAMHIAGLCYCSQYLTDGFIPNGVTNTLLDWQGIAFVSVPMPGEKPLFGSGDDVEAYMIVAALLDAGLWEDAEGGYQIHDYLDYNPSREQVLAQRAANAKRQQRHKERVNNDEGNGVSNGVSNTTPVPDPLPVSSSLHSEEKRERTRGRVADKPPTHDAVQVIDSVSEITDDKPYGMVAMLCEENGKEVGTMPPDWASRQRGIAKRLIEQGHAIEQVRAYVRFRKTAWNGNTPFDLRHVEKDIGAWELAGCPSVEAARASPNGNGTSRATAIYRPDTTTTVGHLAMSDEEMNRRHAEAERRAAERMAADG